MKLFYGKNIAQQEIYNKLSIEKIKERDTKFDGEEFIITTVTPATAQAIKDARDNETELLFKKKNRFPFFYLRVLCAICLAYYIIAIGYNILRFGKNIEQAFEYNFPPFWSVAIALIIWGILTCIIRRRQARIDDMIKEGFDLAYTKAYTELGVPLDSDETTIISFSYEIKDGTLVLENEELKGLLEYTFECKIYTHEGYLYISDTENKYAFALFELRAIRKIKRKLHLALWHSPTNEIEHIKSYYVLELEHDGEIWGIYFPDYLLSQYESLTGLTAED